MLRHARLTRKGFLRLGLGSAAALGLAGTAAVQPRHARAAPLAQPRLVPAARLQMGMPDPRMAEVLDQLAMFNAPPIESLAPRQARELPSVADAVMGVMAKRNQPPAVEMVGKVENRVIPGPTPEGTLVRIYTPMGAGPFPVTVYFHGGGWVIANLNVYDGSARALTNASNSMVVSVAYRLAPEAKFPAAHEDAYSAVQWVMANAASMNGDPNRVAVAGESAGGNLATATAMMARDMGGMMPKYQLLVYPVTQFGQETDSYREHANAKPLNRAMLDWFAGYFLRDGADREDPRVSPLRAPDLSGMPPAMIITAEIDPLRDEGEAYAARLREFGVPVEAMRYDGVTHEFFGTGAVVDKAKQAVAMAGQGLRSAFDTMA